MSTPESWALTPREFEARCKVREMYMAQWRAEIRNAPHFRREDHTPWTMEHFLGTVSDKKQSAIDKAGFLKAQAELALLKMNPEIVPDWAKTPYRPLPKKEVANG